MLVTEIPDEVFSFRLLLSTRRHFTSVRAGLLANQGSPFASKSDEGGEHNSYLKYDSKSSSLFPASVTSC